MNYGLELEYFVQDLQGNIVPAYKVTHNVDGDPVIGEIRTGVFDNIVDAVFDLKKRVYLEVEALRQKNAIMVVTPQISVSKEFLVNLRKDKRFTDAKVMQPLEEFSIYPKGATGKLLPREQFKASLQINISVNNTVKHVYTDKENRAQTFQKTTSDVFDYYRVIQKLDEEFNEAITKTLRVKGVYAIKQGTLGTRIEYRSLPNNVNLYQIIECLNKK